MKELKELKELLESKIEELENEIENSKDYLDDTKESSKRTGEAYYYNSFAEVYTELNKFQYAQDILYEILEEIDKENEEE